jgi:hypothetical protein
MRVKLEAKMQHQHLLVAERGSRTVGIPCPEQIQHKTVFSKVGVCWKCRDHVQAGKPDFLLVVASCGLLLSYMIAIPLVPTVLGKLNYCQPIKIPKWIDWLQFTILHRVFSWSEIAHISKIRIACAFAYVYRRQRK